jgi:hypothetical protein
VSQGRPRQIYAPEPLVQALVAFFTEWWNGGAPRTGPSPRLGGEDEISSSALLSLQSFNDGGIGSSIATPGIITLRCIREKCEWLLVTDETSHDQYKQREWFNQSWDDVLHRDLVHGRQSAGNAQSAMPGSIPSSKRDAQE